jgi:hypothetical protein
MAKVWTAFRALPWWAQVPAATAVALFTYTVATTPFQAGERPRIVTTTQPVAETVAPTPTTTTGSGPTTSAVPGSSPTTSPSTTASAPPVTTTAPATPTTRAVATTVAADTTS